MKTINSYITEKLHLTAGTRRREYKFAGIEIARGLCHYDGVKLGIQEGFGYYPYECGIQQKNLKKEGSYYFNYYELGKYLDGSSFNSDDKRYSIKGTIEGYRLPTKKEVEKIISKDREGTIVNGIKGCCWAIINIKDNGDFGLLLFPDSNDMHGADLICNEVSSLAYSGNEITREERDDYIQQGCMYLPAGGYHLSNDRDKVVSNQYVGCYITADSCSDTSRYSHTLYFDLDTVNTSKLYKNTNSRYGIFSEII